MSPASLLRPAAFFLFITKKTYLILFISNYKNKIKKQTFKEQHKLTFHVWKGVGRSSMLVLSYPYYTNTCYSWTISKAQRLTLNATLCSFSSHALYPFYLQIGHIEGDPERKGVFPMSFVHILSD